jgi:hypothetical protein
MLTLQELSDRAEISDIVARLGYTQDDKDFDGLAALFADRIGFETPAAGGDPATDITRDELASLARTVLSGFTATQHRASNVLTTVDGDIAHCRAMVDAWHTVPTDPGIADFYTARNTCCSGSSESTGDGSSRSGPSRQPHHPTATRVSTTLPRHEPHRTVRLPVRSSKGPGNRRDAGNFGSARARAPAVPVTDVPLRECPRGRTRVPVRPRRRLRVVLRATPRRRASADR